MHHEIFAVGEHKAAIAMWTIIGTSILMVISPILFYHPERKPRVTFFCLFVAFTGSYVGSAFPLYEFWLHLDSKS